MSVQFRAWCTAMGLDSSEMRRPGTILMGMACHPEERWIILATSPKAPWGASRRNAAATRAASIASMRPSKGRKLRCRAPQSVVSEMEALLAQGVDCLHLCDAEFNLPASHAEDVCREIMRRGLGEKIGWYAYASPVPFSSEMAALYRKAGCRGINFGVDSADDDILRALGRDYGADDLRRTAEACHEQGLVFMYDLLLGGPGRDQAKHSPERSRP